MVETGPAWTVRAPLQPVGVAEHPAGLAHVAHRAGDGEVRGHAFQRDHAGLDQPLVHLPAVAHAGSLEGARASRASSSGSRSRPTRSRASWMARAAYLSTCTVSMPDISEKNQPQLVNMSSDWRCSSSRLRARTSCWAAARARPAASGTRRPRAARGPAPARRRRPGPSRHPGTGRSLPLEDGVDPIAQPLQRRPQRAPPGLPPARPPPVLQPQSERHRSTPWAQLHEAPSTISASHSAGTRRSTCPRFTSSTSLRPASWRSAAASTSSPPFLWWPSVSPSKATVRISSWPRPPSNPPISRSMSLPGEPRASPKARSRAMWPS